MTTHQAYNKTRTQSALQYKVHGYWSYCYISVSLKDGSVGWGTGGRDEAEEPCDNKAARNFVTALSDALNFAESIKPNA